MTAMRKAVVLVGLALSVTPGFGQAKDQGHEVCQAHGGRCLPIKPPNLPTAPANWSMPRTHEGKPDFTGVYAGAGFTHQVGANDTDTPIIRGFDGKVMPPTKAGGDAILFRPVTGKTEIDDPIGLCLPFHITNFLSLRPAMDPVRQIPGHSSRVHGPVQRRKQR